jgi:hypothetical protein
VAKRVYVLAGLLILISALAACGNESLSSLSPSARLAELRALAERSRAPKGETQAWWVGASYAEASRLVGMCEGDYEENPFSSSQTYLVILKGDFANAEGTPYKWLIMTSIGVGDECYDTGRFMNRRPRTEQSWTPLGLSSPEPSTAL